MVSARAASSRGIMIAPGDYLYRAVSVGGAAARVREHTTAAAPPRTRCSRGFIQSPRRAGEQCRRHVEPEHLRGLEINHEFKCGRLHDGRRAPSELIELLSIRCDSERSCFDLKAFFIYFPSTSTNQSRNLHLSSLLGAWTSDAIDLSVLDQLRRRLGMPIRSFSRETRGGRNALLILAQI